MHVNKYIVVCRDSGRVLEKYFFSFNFFFNVRTHAYDTQGNSSVSLMVSRTTLRVPACTACPCFQTTYCPVPRIASQGIITAGLLVVHPVDRLAVVCTWQRVTVGQGCAIFSSHHPHACTSYVVYTGNCPTPYVAQP